jgi:hypothetical protein
MLLGDLHAGQVFSCVHASSDAYLRTYFMNLCTHSSSKYCVEKFSWALHKKVYISFFCQLTRYLCVHVELMMSPQTKGYYFPTSLRKFLKDGSTIQGQKKKKIYEYLCRWLADYSNAHKKLAISMTVSLNTQNVRKKNIKFIVSSLHEYF